eukprot:9348733-Pyramimonas_sp.AAC.1
MPTCASKREKPYPPIFSPMNVAMPRCGGVLFEESPKEINADVFGHGAKYKDNWGVLEATGGFVAI